MNPALIVFGKQPVTGEVKTRLTPQITAEEAARLYKAFIEDALEQYARMSIDVRVYMSAPTAGSGAKKREESADAEPGAAGRLPLSVPPAMPVFDQRGSDLGARMLEAFAETFEAGYDRVVIVGTDHPSLPPTTIRESFDPLEDDDSVVIGPAEDGGYYLLGMRRLRPELFRGMNYSHGGVFNETLRRINDAAGRATVLQRWYDVDRPEDLPRLFRDLEADGGLARRTLQALRDLAKKYAWLRNAKP